MYDPRGNGKDRDVEAVQFHEVAPPAQLAGIVHRFLELKTQAPLQEDYRFHALPDVCTYMVFDQLETQVAGVTGLRTTSEELNLGKTFHYVNIRFLPGVWQCEPEQINYGMVDAPYTGSWPLIEINTRLSRQHDLAGKQSILAGIVQWLMDAQLVAANPMVRSRQS
ncbi:MAG: DUF6597 domain-containing transcriptional factor [Bacteroidota bacterium]